MSGAITEQKRTPLLRAMDVANFLNINLHTVYEMVKDGRLPKPIRLPGGAFRWPADAIDAFIKQPA